MKTTIVLALALTGCAHTTLQERLTENLKTCVTLGYTPDTDNARNCALQLEAQRHQRAANALSVIRTTQPQPIRQVP